MKFVQKLSHSAVGLVARRLGSAAPISSRRARFGFFSTDSAGPDELAYDIHGRASLIAPEVNPGEYRASFRGGDPANRKTFGRKSFLMPISVGQQVHENGKLRATFSLVSRSFPTGVILVDDSIQWHTMKVISPGQSDEELRRRSLAEGDVWLKRYAPMIDDAFEGRAEIVRWEESKEISGFEENVRKVKDLLESDPMYHEAFERNINEFIGRLFKRNPGLDYALAYAKTRDYLIEECGNMVGWDRLFDPSLGGPVEVYPSDRNHAMEATSKAFFESSDRPEGLEKVGLRFKKVSKNNVHSREQRYEEEREEMSVAV